MKLQSERGAVIIHVAMAMVAMLLFTGMAIDQGAMLVARSQAQAAADAGALAGAQSLLEAPANVALALASAKHFAQMNAVWGQTTAAAHVYVPPIPFTCPNDSSLTCVRVDVLRGLPDSANNAHGNTMPTMMMSMVGINSQGTRATATAQVAAGNAVRCIKPLVVADKWVDNTPASPGHPAGYDQNDTFDPGDVYTRPGFSAATDIGLELVLKGDGHDWSSGFTLKINLGLGLGADVFREELATCLDDTPTVGLYNASVTCDAPSDANPEAGCIRVETGVSEGPTRTGVGRLVALDPSATWDSATNTVTGGCTSAGNCLSVNPLEIGISPRIVPIALFDPQAYKDSGCSGSTCVTRIMNLLGFFVEGMCDDVYPTSPPTYCGAHPNQVVVGRLMTYPGQGDGASGPAGPATFLKVTRLVR